MPLYEYFCEDCKKFEHLSKSYKDKLTTCPKCGKDVKLLLSTCALKFVGSGFFVNEYPRSKNDKRDNKETK